MSNVHKKKIDEEELTEEDLKQLVAEGLRKQKKCALCEHVFFVPELPGAISWKSVLELRKKWDESKMRLYRVPSPSQLYQRVELCIFCVQFFSVDEQDTEGIPFSATQLKERPADYLPYAVSPKKKKNLQMEASQKSNYGSSGKEISYH